MWNILLKKINLKYRYKAFIYYCNINIDKPLDEQFAILCGENTSGFHPNDSIEKKVKVMKQE